MGIGNLALLYQPENSHAGNEAYSDKVKVYNQPMKDKGGVPRGVPSKTFRLIEDLIKRYPKEFDEESVKERSKELAKIAVKAWS